MTVIEQLFQLEGKVALVTGGYGGIGEAVCKGLACAGARIGIAGRNRERASACAESLKAEGYDAWATSFEATSVPDTQRMVDDVSRHFGKLDILVNCVGLNREESAEEVTEEMFDYVCSVNLKSAMFQAQAVARCMIQAGRQAVDKLHLWLCALAACVTWPRVCSLLCCPGADCSYAYVNNLVSRMAAA